MLRATARVGAADVINERPVIRNRVYVGDDANSVYRRVLCVCSMGLLRSPTAAYVLSQVPYEFNTRACGVEPDALVPLTAALVEWAQEIVCMEESHADHVEQYCDGSIAPVYVLGIPDDYEYRSPHLARLVRQRYGVAPRPLP